MSCWENLIGINRQCADDISESGFFIQDLPFIDIKTGDAALTADQESGIELLQAKMDFATKAVIAMVRTNLLKNIEFVSNIDNDTIGYYQNNLNVVASEAGFYKGIRVTINKSPYLEFDLHSVTLQLAEAKTVTVKIFDLITGNQIGDDISVTTTVNGLTEVEVNRKIISEKQRMDFIIVFDSGEANTYKTSIHRSYRRTCSHCTETWNGGVGRFSGIKVLQAATKVESNLSSINGTNGMSINYTLNCSVESFICNLGRQLAYGILLRQGAEILKELQYSKRLSSIVTVQAGNIKSLRAEFMDDYNEFMDDNLNNMILPNDICFRCAPRVAWQNTLP